MVNVGHMLCPAVSDPFAGPTYRIWGIFHQALSILVTAFLIGLINFAAETFNIFKKLKET